ncbi:MAG: CehA/McbA family metallohydrolase [Ardenticatenales bacterium]|nr:CehA/McbA family metallohydrolase [Ardenticatenales bacterium]
MFYQSPGALHMHTFYSDGTGSVRDLALAAKECGLEWIWITDHDTMQGKPEEGIIEGVRTLVGYEITPHRNHFLVGDVDEIISRDLSPAEYVAEVARRGGVGIVAHPDERATNEVTEPYRWDDWAQRGFTGIELWNYMSDWVEQYTPVRKYFHFFFPSVALRGPTSDTLRWWDELQVEGARPTGVFGVDVHAKKVARMGREWEVFPYTHCFNRLVDYLQLEAPLSSTFKEAEQQIWDAIRRGRIIMANQGRGSAAGTTFLALSPGSAPATCGDEVARVQGLTLEFVCPRPAEIRLFQNGTLVARVSNGQKLRFDCHEPGHYRVEAWRRTLWIMTNHIHVI